MHIIYFEQKLPELSAIILFVVAIYIYITKYCLLYRCNLSLVHASYQRTILPAKRKRSNHISNLTLMTAIYQVEYFPWVGFKPPHGNKVILTEDMAYILIRSVSIRERIYIFHNSYILNCYK